MYFSPGERTLSDLVKKVGKGERLAKEDGTRLLESNDLLAIGYMANIVRERKNSDNAYFIQNRHINHTNICVNRCKLCAFGVDKDDETAYILSHEDIKQKITSSAKGNIKELHIVGGMHSDLPYSYYKDIIKLAHEAMPQVHIKAFTAVEIDFFSEITNMTPAQVLEDLRSVGLGSLPGGGAEIFSERVRKKICEKKISGSRWLEIHAAAHSIGMKTNATMLYGHIETNEERIDHLIQLREQQDRTGGFQAFIPLAFHPRFTGLEKTVKTRTTGFEDIKVLAVSRLMLDNFPHIKAYWVMVGPKLAQVALSFGADDIDGTIVEEKITHAAGAETEQALSVQDIVNMIKAAGRKPIERDTLYNVVREEF